ncbi:hypothetical protein C8T65DRAFT_695143 [Cerioporus squamosus]|nr:hypothetical protein C8T65DRAFT_695143 [Cerioporus squamosus]
MSSDADAAAAAIIELSDSLYTSRYCQMATVVVFIFDVLITFDRDVACFWNSKWTGASLLFFANKWISITLYLISLVEFASFHSDKFVPGAVGSNLVVYGYHLSGGNFPPFGCLETDGISAALSFRFAVQCQPLTPPTLSVIQQSQYAKRTLIHGTAVVILSRVPLIAADILLIYITWTKLSSWAALRGIRFSKRLSLSDILFHGGTIYFIVLFAMNVLHLVFTATAVAGDGSGGESIIPMFTGPITAVLISHFLLALQEASQMTVRLDRDDPLHSSRNPWDSTSSFISSLGGFIDPDLSARSDEDGFDSELQVRSPPEAREEEGRAQAESRAAASSSSV